MSSSEEERSGEESSDLDTKPRARDTRSGNKRKRRSSSLSSASSRHSKPAEASLDLTVTARELKKKYGVRGKKEKALAPPNNWRISEAKVKQWYGLTREQQTEEQEKWKKLSRTEKQDYTDKVPGSSNKKEAKKAAPVSSRSRSKADHREKVPTSLSDSRMNRKKKADDTNKKPKPTRKKDTKAETAAQQVDKQVRRLEKKALLSVAELVNATTPATHAKKGPRKRYMLICINDAPRNERGRPKKNIEKRDKPQFLALGHGSVSFKKSTTARKISEFLEDPESFEVTELLQESTTEGNIVERTSAYIQQMQKSNPNTNVLDGATTSANIPSEVVSASVETPSQMRRRRGRMAN